MKHTKEEIIGALKVIKEECSGSDCRKCPLGDIYGNCLLVRKGTPERKWNIAGPDDETWRAFK